MFTTHRVSVTIWRKTTWRAESQLWELSCLHACVQQRGRRAWGLKSCHCIRSALGTVIVISEGSWHASRENNDVFRRCREAKSLLLPSTAELCNQRLNAIPGQSGYNCLQPEQSKVGVCYQLPEWHPEILSKLTNKQRDKFEPEPRVITPLRNTNKHGTS